MRVYVGDQSNPYNALTSTSTAVEQPEGVLKDYTQVLLADAYGGYNGVVAGNAITRAGCWSHARRKFVEAEKAAPEIAREAVTVMDALFAVRQTSEAAPLTRGLSILPRSIRSPELLRKREWVASHSACVNPAIARRDSTHR